MSQKQKMFLSLLIVYLVLPSFSFAQSPSGGAAGEETPKWEKEYLEALRTSDPPAYQEALKQKESVRKFTEIVNAFHEGRMKESEARRKLTPFAREAIDNQMEYIDIEITQTTQRLDHLRRMKRTSYQVLVEELIDGYLRKTVPEEKTP